MPFCSRFPSVNMCRFTVSSDTGSVESRVSNQCGSILQSTSHILRVMGPCFLMVGLILMTFDFCNTRSEGRVFADKDTNIKTL